MVIAKTGRNGIEAGGGVVSTQPLDTAEHGLSIRSIYCAALFLVSACGTSNGEYPQGKLALTGDRPKLMESATVEPYSGSNQFVLEAETQHRTGLELHRNVIIRTCGPTGGVCHNQKEYPDLHTPSNLISAIKAPCNVQSDWDTVFDGCELPGDRFQIHADSGEVELGYLEYIPGEREEGSRDSEPNAETPGLHLYLHDPVQHGDRSRTWSEARFKRNFIDEDGDLSELTFAHFQTQWWILDEGKHVYGEVREYQVDRVNELISVGVQQGDVNRNGVYGAQESNPLSMIEAGNPGASYLIGRLRGELHGSPIPGTRMPLANEPLSIADMLALYCFIEGLPTNLEGVPDLKSPIDYNTCQSAVDPEGLNLLGNGATWLGRVQPLLAANCGGCHGGEEPAAAFDVLTEGVYERLLEHSLQVPTMPFVTPGDPSNSYLWLKLTSGEGIVGLGMPIDPLEGLRMLPPGALADIETWILNGAAAEE